MGNLSLDRGRGNQHAHHHQRARPRLRKGLPLPAIGLRLHRRARHCAFLLVPHYFRGQLDHRLSAHRTPLRQPAANPHRRSVPRHPRGRRRRARLCRGHRRPHRPRQLPFRNERPRPRRFCHRHRHVSSPSIYTFEGGMAAVIWTDVVQLAVYLAGALAAVFVLALRSPAAGPTITPSPANAGKFRVFDLLLELDLHLHIVVRHHRRRILHHRQPRHRPVDRPAAARRAQRTPSQTRADGSGFAVFLQFSLFLLIGAMLFVFYRTFPRPAPSPAPTPSFRPSSPPTCRTSSAASSSPPSSRRPCRT